MSRMVQASRYTGLGYFPTHAIGNESQVIQQNMRQFFDAVIHNVVSIQPRLDAVRTLVEKVHRQCAEENWDGEGASPVSLQTVREAAKFLAALPLSVRTPEIVPEPSGAIGFEWRLGPNAIFVVSVHGLQTLTYAGLFGAGITSYGTEEFNDSIPGTVIAHLQRLQETR